MFLVKYPRITKIKIYLNKNIIVVI
jgi:hypothetical protein